MISISYKVGDHESVFVECLKDGLDYDFNLDEDLTAIHTPNRRYTIEVWVWAKKFGAEIYNLKDGWFNFSIDGNIEVKYLHQLQNLYFALTGKELDIKLWPHSVFYILPIKGMSELKFDPKL